MTGGRISGTFRLTFVAAVALMDAACVGPNVLPPAAGSASQTFIQNSGQAYSSGTTAASKVLSAEVSAAPDVDRGFQVFDALPLAFRNDNTYDGSFAQFACAGLDDGASASAAITTASQMATIVGELSAKPASDLGSVLSDISKYDGVATPEISLPKPPGNQAQGCQSTVNNSLALLRSPIKPHFVLAAIPAVITGLQALYSAAKTVITDIVQIEDIDVRRAELVKFLADPNTDKAMTSALGACGHYDSTKSVNPDGTLAALPACDGPLAKGAEIDQLFTRRVASTLVVAFAQYADTMKSQKSLPPHVIAERLATVQSNLSAFDAVRTQAAPGDLAVPIAKAYLSLRRIVDGKLTVAEERQSFSDDLNNFYSTMNQLYKDINNLDTKAQAADKDINKL